MTTIKTPKIVPFLWFDGKAEEAALFYTSIFKNSGIGSINRMGKDGPAMSVTFQLEDQVFYALNAGPQYHFTPAISMFINCDTQEEVDELWEKLSEGGQLQPCGWLQDKFGLSWQVIPTLLGKLLGDPNPAKAQSVMNAMLQMSKIEMKGLQEAYDAA